MKITGMSNSDPSPVSIEGRRKNLAVAGSRAFAALQRLVDVSQFFLGGSLLISEKDFTEFRAEVKFSPSEANTLSFERTKFESPRWLLRHVLREAIDTTVVLLEDIRSVCAMAGHTGEAGEALKESAGKIIGSERGAFGKLSLKARLEHLRNHFGVESKHSLSLLSLTDLAACLQFRAGVVSKKEAGADGLLTVYLSGFRIREREDRDEGAGGGRARVMLSRRAGP